MSYPTRLISLAIYMGMAFDAMAQIPPMPPEPTTPHPTQSSPNDGWVVAESAQSPEPGGLTLANLEQMALACHPSLAKARAGVRAARGSWLQSGLYPNPTLGYLAEEMGRDGSAGMQGGYVAQEFVTADKLHLNRAVASQEVARAEREVSVEQQRVLTDVRLGFYRALVAQRRVALAEQLLGVAEAGLDAAEALNRAQQTSQVDVLETRIQVHSTRLVLANAKNEAQAAWKALAAMSGRPCLAPSPLSGDMVPGPALDWNDTLSTLLCRSPELAVANAELQRARWSVERAYAERYPNWQTGANVVQDTATGETLAGVQLGVALPLFNRNQGNLLRAEAEVSQAQRNIERIRLDLQNRLADAFREYSNARDEVNQYRGSILPDAKSALDLVAAAYRQGEVGYLNLLAAQRTYIESNLAYLNASLQLKSAEAAMDGLLLRGSLGGGAP